MDNSTRNQILITAAGEMLAKGYRGVSMRSIAGKVGITPIKLYRHFANKEALFDALVEPATTALKPVYENRRAQAASAMQAGGAAAMWAADAGAFVSIVQYVYSHYDAFKLLICCSADTRYSNYTDQLVELFQKDTEAFLEKAKSSGEVNKDLVLREVLILLRAQLNAFFDIVRQDFTYDEALHFALTLENFFRPSWQALMKL